MLFRSVLTTTSSSSVRSNGSSVTNWFHLVNDLPMELPEEKSTVAVLVGKGMDVNLFNVTLCPIVRSCGAFKHSLLI